ncbi:glutamine amidotransferase [Kaistia dalseonensis]|uniref:GMP synthase (Glutamine-hydrolyzing) n=1 Tax=Kaistia dalseonensis TaxID=410840 RepID=A0ABU0H5N4_9HYPH|nr:glutamine amidotransferase [Kaistia dalseonensis]MCX5495030.1 glutamine amidotransferase [Kaistia dalseonensis]MDQ0437612.1 GMP synthase (glutamine-hydrolyzing) [Kaistia dalseonensis]
MKPPVLIVLHQEHSTPGRVGQRLVARGHKLDIRRPRFGDALPATLDGHAGAIVFGGPMSANDDEPYVRGEIDWLRVALAEEAPLLGICLGAQMLARHLGARVSRRPDGLVEIGYYPLRATEAGQALCTWPQQIYQWHNEGFELPAGATLLAAGDLFQNQAFRYGPSAFAFQFHIELTLAMMVRWTTRGAERFSLPGAQERRHHIEGRALYDVESSAFLDAFLDVWLALPRQGRDARLGMAAE